VSTHNAGAIFNTDICGGLPAVVVAMLVRVRGDRIDLLPADDAKNLPTPVIMLALAIACLVLRLAAL
jgi:hypothetical protein